MLISVQASLAYLWTAEIRHANSVQWWQMAPLLPGLCRLVLAGECGFHSLLQFFCFVFVFELYELEEILAGVFECKAMLHPPKCPQSPCSSSRLGIWSTGAGWMVGLWGVLWHMHEDESPLSSFCESNSLENVSRNYLAVLIQISVWLNVRFSLSKDLEHF